MMTTSTTSLAPAVTVRRAVPADVPALLPMLRAFALHFSRGLTYSIWPADEGYASYVLLGLIDHQLVLVAERGTEEADEQAELVGVIGGFVIPHLFNPDIRVLTELFWWVRPADRGSSAGARLLAAFEAYGQQHAEWVTMVLEHDSVVTGTSLARRGYVARERGFLLEVASDTSSDTSSEASR